MIIGVDRRYIRSMAHSIKMEQVYGIVAIALSLRLGVRSQTPQYADNLLVSQDKPTSMSSTLDHPYLWEAKLAVDGNLRQDAMNCTCCAGAMPDMPATFTLNLENRYRISQINIYGSQDSRIKGPLNALSGLKLYVSNTYKIQDGVLVHTIDRPLSYENITVHEHVTYQYVIAQMVHSKYLILCEIQVYTPVCKDGYYDDCTKPCGQCLNNDVCSKTTGVCPRGCKPGYKTSMCHTGRTERREQTTSTTVWILRGAVGVLGVLVICSAGIIAFLMRRTSQLQKDVDANKRETTNENNTALDSTSQYENYQTNTAISQYEMLNRDQVQRDPVPNQDYETLQEDDDQYENS